MEDDLKKNEKKMEDDLKKNEKKMEDDLKKKSINQNQPNWL
jgi:hypothetical protein